MVVLDCQPFVDRQRFIASSGILIIWSFNGNMLDDQSSVTLTISKASISSEGTYQCVALGNRGEGRVVERRSRDLVVRGNNMYKCPTKYN